MASRWLVVVTAWLALLLLASPVLAEECTTIALVGEFKTPSGSLSQPFGDEIRRGAELATAYLTQRPDARCLRLTQIDINNSIANIDGHIREAAQRGIRFFVGLGTTDEALAAQRAIIETGSTLVTPTASSDELLVEKGRTILLYPTNSDIAVRLAEEARRRGVERVLVLYAENKRYSTHLSKAFEREFTARGGTIAGAVGLRAGRISLDASIDRIKRLSFTHIFLPLFELDAAKAILSLRQHGIDSTFIASDSWGTYSTVISNLVRPQSVRALAPVIYSASSANALNSFVTDEYRKRYGKRPTDLGAFSFDAVLLIEAILRRCSPETLASQLDQCLTSLLPFESTTGPIQRAAGLALKRQLAVQEFSLGMSDGQKP